MKPHRAFTAITIAFLILGTIYSIVTPLFEASDEMWHYPYVKHLADGHGLPVQQPGVEQPWRQEGSQPPLYYTLAALATFWINTDDISQLLWRNPHADIGIPKLDRNVNMIIHTEREAFPYRGTALAVHIIRWLSVLMGVLTLLCTYRIALDIFPARQAVAIGATAFVAFNPMFLFISGSINNDNLATALSSFALWRILRLIDGEDRLRHLALLGLTLGLAALSKASALGLFGLAALALVIVAYRQRSWRSLIQGGVILYGLAAILSGWWFVRNWRLYGDPSGLKTFVSIVGPRYPKPTLLQLWGERVGFTMSFWGFFGGMNVPASKWVYRLLDGLAGLGLIGLSYFLLRDWWSLTVKTRLKFLLLLAWPTIVLASLVRWTLMTIATQGRLMFASISAMAILVVLGGVRWAPRREGLVVGFIVALFFAFAAISPFAYIAPAYARPPILSESELPADIERLDAVFGSQMQLVGYKITPAAVRPGEHATATLYWRSLAPMSENYSVFVHLLADNDLIVGQRDMYPGQGTYPTSLWQVGGLIADTYAVPVSPAMMTPAVVQIEVGLYLLETQERLTVVDRHGASIGDHVRFGRIAIERQQAGDIPNPVYFNLDNKIALVGYDLDRTAAKPGEAFHLTLYWKCLKQMKHDYSVFTHVLGEDQRIWAQKDAWPQDGNAPTSAWRPGQIIKDSYELLVKDEAPAGAWDLEVGVYRGDTGERLNLLGAGGHAQDNRILLGKVRIVRP